MAEIENKKTKRELLNERLSGRYPDMDFTDDEVLAGRINDDYDDYESQLSGYRENEKKITDLFNSDPRSASFMIGWSEGADPAVELVRQFGTDIKEAIDDPERQEAIAAANKEYLERVAKSKELEEQYQANIAESLKHIDELQAKNGLTDEQVDAAMALILQIANDAVVGKFTPETIEMAMKAINHDADVTEASYEGEVRGRNTKIDETLRKRQSGDGVANLGGKNNIPTQKQNRIGVFALADEAR